MSTTSPSVTLLSDGTTVYECTSSEEVVDLLRGGQGVFGIAVSGALRELSGRSRNCRPSAADGVDESDVERPVTNWPDADGNAAPPADAAAALTPGS